MIETLIIKNIRPKNKFLKRIKMIAEMSRYRDVVESIEVFSTLSTKGCNSIDFISSIGFTIKGITSHFLITIKRCRLIG